MPVGNSPRAQVSRNPEFPLLPRLRPQPRKLLRIPRVIEQIFPLQPLHHAFDNLFVLAPPRQRLFHLMDRMRPPHQDLDGSVIHLPLGFEGPWFAEHGSSIGSASQEVKNTDCAGLCEHPLGYLTTHLVRQVTHFAPTHATPNSESLENAL